MIKNAKNIAFGLDADRIQQIGLLKQSITENLDNHHPKRAADLADQVLVIDPRDAELLFLSGGPCLPWAI